MARSSLRIGEAVIHAAQLRDRCVMTTYDPDTLKQDMGHPEEHRPQNSAG